MIDTTLRPSQLMLNSVDVISGFRTSKISLYQRDTSEMFKMKSEHLTGPIFSKH
jgi:uncharacterized protein YcbK (DUF882 family)